MPFYVESPLERIVNVHWKKKEPPHPPGETGPGAGICGEGRYGFLPGLPAGAMPFLWLDIFGMYYMSRDPNPGRQPDIPWRYQPAFYEYVTLGLSPWMPFFWNTPGSWTVNYVGSIPPGYSFRINVWYNVNPQAFLESPPPRVGPDFTYGGTTAEIDFTRFTSGRDLYPPFFTVEYDTGRGGGFVPHPYPGLEVQGHCREETTGGLPPQPDGWGTTYNPLLFIPYPAPGTTNEPVRPSPN